MPPEQGCPNCEAWALVKDWTQDPERPFRVRCPACGVSVDVADVRYRLRVDPPSEASEAP